MMKKYLVLFVLLSFGMLFGQFKIKLNTSNALVLNTVSPYVYGYEGSQPILLAKGNKAREGWEFNVATSYSGMMRFSFSQENVFYAISENRDVSLSLETSGEKISKVSYLDEANKLFDRFQNIKTKKEKIVPMLVKMKGFYDSGSDFGVALEKEIKGIEQADTRVDPIRFPFVDFYVSNYDKYVSGNHRNTKASLINFLSHSPNYLESSVMIRSVLQSYLSLSRPDDLEKDVDKLLDTVILESSRGQLILSEIITIFDISGMESLKENYLAKANSLKCTISNVLSSTIEANKNVALYTVLPDHKFSHPLNTKASSIHAVKAKKKLIFFWSSSCPHCETEIPKILEAYTDIKQSGAEVIGLSLDTEAKAYNAKVKMLPWINDSELKGWNSSFAERYNVNATPLYLLLDADNKIIAKPTNFGQALDLILSKK